MKIRRGYKLKTLETKIIKLRLIGGEDDYTAYCSGYYAGGKELAPSRKFLAYNTDAKLKNIESVQYFESIGAGIVLTTSGQIYKWSNLSVGSPFAYSGLVGTYLHSAFDCYYQGAPAVAVVSGPRITFVAEEKYYNKMISFQLKGACEHTGRIFAVDTQNDYVVRWSGTDLTDWTQSADGSGYIKLNPERGALFRTVDFGDKLVIFREFGLDVLKTYGDPRHFAMTRQGCKNVTEKLIEDTLVVCGNRLYFCSYDKIYCYDGENMEILKLPEYMKARNFRSGKSYDSRYVYFYCSPENSESRRQLEIDTAAGTFSFFAPDMQFLWKTDSGLWGWKDNTVYIENSNGYDMPCVWRTDGLDMDRSGVKTLKSVYLKQTGDAVLNVTADGVTRRVKGCGKIPVGMSGREFVFEITGKGRTKRLEAEWEVRL